MSTCRTRSPPAATRNTLSSASPPASCADLNEPELEAVLAHELSHVADRDVAVMTIASFLGILAGLLTRVLAYGVSSVVSVAEATGTRAAGVAEVASWRSSSSACLPSRPWFTPSASSSSGRSRATGNWRPTAPGRS